MKLLRRQRLIFEVFVYFLRNSRAFAKIIIFANFLKKFFLLFDKAEFWPHMILCELIK